MLSLFPSHGATYLTVLSLLSTVSAGGYHPEPSDTDQCKPTVDYTTITPSITLTASAETVTVTVSSVAEVSSARKHYLARGYPYDEPKHNATTPIISTPASHETPTPTPQPTPQGTGVSCPPVSTSTAFAPAQTFFVTPLITETALYPANPAVPLQSPTNPQLPPVPSPPIFTPPGAPQPPPAPPPAQPVVTP
jgi:hypothetical protein